VLTALCAVGFALQILYAAKYAQQFPAGVIGFAQLTLAALMCTVLWGVDGFSLAGFEARFIGPLVFMGVINTAVGFVGQFFAYRYTRASVASLIFSLEPIFATAFAMVIPGSSGHCETLTLKTGLGALLVLTGVAIAMWDSFRPKKTASAIKTALEAAE
jgi:drug/metabolite transporter (DMT)-like permease